MSRYSELKESEEKFTTLYHLLYRDLRKLDLLHDDMDYHFYMAPEYPNYEIRFHIFCNGRTASNSYDEIKEVFGTVQEFIERNKESLEDRNSQGPAFSYYYREIPYKDLKFGLRWFESVKEVMDSEDREETMVVTEDFSTSHTYERPSPRARVKSSDDTSYCGGISVEEKRSISECLKACFNIMRNTEDIYPACLIQNVDRIITELGAELSSGETSV